MWIRRYEAVDAFPAFEFINYLWPSCEWLWKQLRSDIPIFSFHSSPSSSAKRIFIMNDVATAKWKEIWINNWSFIVEFHTEQHSSYCRSDKTPFTKFQQNWASATGIWFTSRVMMRRKNSEISQEPWGSTSKRISYQ